MTNKLIFAWDNKRIFMQRKKPTMPGMIHSSMMGCGHKLPGKFVLQWRKIIWYTMSLEGRRMLTVMLWPHTHTNPADIITLLLGNWWWWQWRNSEAVPLMTTNIPINFLFLCRGVLAQGYPIRMMINFDHWCDDDDGSSQDHFSERESFTWSSLSTQTPTSASLTYIKIICAPSFSFSRLLKGCAFWGNSCGICSQEIPFLSFSLFVQIEKNRMQIIHHTISI